MNRETPTRADDISNRLVQLLAEVIATIRNGQLEEATRRERLESDRMGQAIQRVIEALGPENVIYLEDQTRFSELPMEVLDAIEILLEDSRLSTPGKILEIGRILLGEAVVPH